MVLQTNYSNPVVLRKNLKFFAALILFAQSLMMLVVPSAGAASAAITNVVFSPATTTSSTTAEKLYSLQFRNASNGAEALDAPATVELTTSSSTGEFAEGTASGNPWTHVATYTTGVSASKSFRYRDTSPGTHTLHANVFGGGLSSSMTAEATITVSDVTPPSVPVASPNGGVYASLSVTLSSTDNSGEVPSIYYTTDGTPPTKMSSLYVAPLTITSTTTLKAVAYDTAGNSSKVMTELYTIDTTPPVIQSVTYSNNGQATNKDVVVTITTDKSARTPSGWTSVDDKTFQKTYSSNQTDSVTVTDAAGNISEPADITVTGIDKSSPVISLSGDQVNGVYTGQVTYHVTDANLGTVTLNGTPASATGMVSADGSYTITATDTVGNMAATVTFTIDTTSPTVALTGMQANGDGTYAISGTVDDGAGVGSSTVTIVVNGISYVVNSVGGVWTLAQTQILPAGGSYTVSISAKDAAGNVSSAVSGIITVPPIDTSEGRTVTLSGVATRALPVLPAVATPAAVVSGGKAAQRTAAADAVDGGGGSMGKKDDAPSRSTVPLTSSTQGWRLFGIAWYWWLLGAGAAAGVGWSTATWYKRRSQDLAGL